ncbi:hypothetical protein COCSADRAFT_328342 [Bipolaris sorokiniana ND90Pr]|uniref:Uncharacterized protein n=1 Tax=Cochliobolus sativus (strain ND90Pr / ATCC 201652) TaxID=665912 RepID=M2T2P2_COCSN|nr:uncharacterized protein COCSADRAFT_328342 [Bipolaris sorokiniana ND90Pr]EMD63476.1 hypothetical protein COCSADRAFT_328342 [Bipolaris sorokiniana ND90Pr]
MCITVVGKTVLLALPRAHVQVYCEGWVDQILGSLATIVRRRLDRRIAFDLPSLSSRP